MGPKDPIGGLQPPLLHLFNFSTTSGSLPESREKEDIYIAMKEMEMKGAIEVTQTPSHDLNILIQCPSFKMETNGSVLKGVQKGQWLTKLDLKDAYFHNIIHPSFRYYLISGSATMVWFGNFELFHSG